MFQTTCHRIEEDYLLQLGLRPAARFLSHLMGSQRFLQVSFLAILFTCLAAADGNGVTVKQLYQTHASLLAGDVVLSNFQLPVQVAYGYSEGANTGDGSDLAVSTISLSNGGVGLVFTPIGGEDGAPKPYYGSSSGGSSGSNNLIQNVTFDVAVSGGGRLLHSVGLRHGIASNWNAGSTFANILYYLQPGTGTAGLLLTDTLNSGQGSALLPGGDTAALRFGDELEISSNHSDGGGGGGATINWYEIDFTLVAAGSPAPAPVTVVPNFVGADPIVGGSTGNGLVRLTSAATTGGAAVHLTSANPGVLSVPEAVVVPQGAVTATFAITAATVTANTSVGLTASLNGTSANGSVQLIATPGTSTPAPPSGPPTSPASLRFIPVAPCRVVDTRNFAGPYGGPVMKDSESREFDIPGGQCNVPGNALAYSMNITVVPSGPLGYLTLWPTGQVQPTVSTLNSDGRVKANAAIVPAGINGAVSVYVTNESHVVIDINGYFVAATNITALAYYPLSPCRVLDTRDATGSLGGPYLNGGRERELLITSSACQIPSDAQAYSMNVTSIPHSPLSYLTIWPSGQSRPGVSTLNAPTGEITANAAIIPAGQGGDISVFATQDTDLVLDVDGYYAAPAAGGLSLYPVPPCRIFDSRSGGHGSGDDSDNEIQGESQITLLGSCGIPASAQAVVMNATVIPASSLQYMTLWPNNSEARPEVSTLNAPDGSVTSNMAVVPTRSGGVKVFTAGRSHLVLDVSTYYAP